MNTMWLVVEEGKKQSNIDPFEHFEYEAFPNKTDAKKVYKKRIKQNKKEDTSVNVLLCEVIKHEEIN
jgi:hypothetical protein